jgi:PPP family 3-phenylpropionic acid transporter
MWLYASSGAFYPFRSLYLESLNFTKLEIGLVIGMAQFLGSVAIILLGKAADRSRNKNKILLGLLFAAGLASSIATSLDGIPLVAMLGLFAALHAPQFPLSDCVAMELVPAKYGSIRLGGPLGYAVSVTLAGFLFQKLSMTIFFPLLAIIFFCAWLSARKISYTPGASVSRQGQGIGWLFKNRSFNIFLVYALISNASIGFYSSFYSLLLKEFGFGQGMVGISYQIAVLAELPFLFWAGYFTRKFSLTALISISGFLLAARWLLVGSCVPAVVFASQLLHGCTYIVLYYATVLLLDSIAEPENKASAQSFHGILANASKIVGVAAGGWLAELWGVGRVFTLLGVVMAVATAVWHMAQQKLGTKKLSHRGVSSAS